MQGLGYVLDDQGIVIHSSVAACHFYANYYNNKETGIRSSGMLRSIDWMLDP